MRINKYDLIIFDCDGTLVDSEYLHNKLNSDVLIGLGLTQYTPEKCIEELAGKAWFDIKKEISRKYQVDVPQEMIDARIPKTVSLMEGNIYPIGGALDFVQLSHQYCKISVGSNGEPETVLKSLELLGFMDFFESQNIFTKNDVTNAKPAPDLFLYAAEKIGVEPSRCLVIEDSVSGAQAGLNAGMDVFGFIGAAHDKKQAESNLNGIGITHIFDGFIHMQDYLKA